MMDPDTVIYCTLHGHPVSYHHNVWRWEGEGPVDEDFMYGLKYITPPISHHGSALQQVRKVLKDFPNFPECITRVVQGAWGVASPGAVS